jgi:sulfur carrier protein ThiS
MTMKRVAVVVAGTGQIKDVQIEPGTTVADVLEQLGLREYLLSRGPNEPFLANADTVYDKVADGEKVFASTKAEVGRCA